jgi:hypothetical protein
MLITLKRSLSSTCKINNNIHATLMVFRSWYVIGMNFIFDTDPQGIYKSLIVGSWLPCF